MIYKGGGGRGGGRGLGIETPTEERSHHHEIVHYRPSPRSLCHCSGSTISIKLAIEPSNRGWAYCSNWLQLFLEY